MRKRWLSIAIAQGMYDRNIIGFSPRSHFKKFRREEEVSRFAYLQAHHINRLQFYGDGDGDGVMADG